MDYVRVVRTADGPYKLHDVVQDDEFAKEIARLKKAGKTPPEAEPHSFYLTAWEEDRSVVAQANAKLNPDLTFSQDRVNARRAGEFKLVPRNEVAYIDVSPKQLVSVAASLIPFLENDDANRALMGSNMQRQAVPLLRPKAPFVGTGMEAVTAKDSRSVVICKRAGVVDLVDSQRIIVQGRCRRPGRLRRGHLLAHEVQALEPEHVHQPAADRPPRAARREGSGHGRRAVHGEGELALGRNVLVAFMPWRGYNFEDAILVSEKLVREDSFTSIHIEEFEIEARDTKLGPEEITRDIPNVAEEFLKGPRRIRRHQDRRPREAGGYSRREGHAGRARRSSPRKRSCFARSSGRSPATFATPR